MVILNVIKFFIFIGLHQSDDSSMHSLDREPAETESSNGLSPTSQITFDSQLETDFGISDSHEFKDESINEYENVTVMKTPQKTENQHCRSGLASNNITCPIPPPRKNRQNCLGAKHKSMTSIDKTNQPLMKQENYSQSENDLQILSGYHENVFKPVPAHKKSSQIIMTGQVPKYSTKNLQQESVGQFGLTKDNSMSYYYSDHEEAVERDERKIGSKSYERILHSKLLDEVDQQNWPEFYQPQQQEQIDRNNHARISHTKSVDEFDQQNWQTLYQQHQHKQENGSNKHTKILRTKPVEEFDQQNWQMHQQQQHEQQIGSNKHARISNTRSVDELGQQNWQHLYEQEQRHEQQIGMKNQARNSHPKSVDEFCQQQEEEQQQFNDQVLHSEKKHLSITRQNPYTLINKSEIQNENKIRLALFEKNLGPYFSKETNLRNQSDIPRNLVLSRPPEVLLKNIGQPVAATKGDQSNKRDISNAVSNSTKHDNSTGVHVSKDKEFIESERVPISYSRQAFSENNQQTQKLLKFYKDESISSSPHTAATAKIPVKPKHPPSYEEVTQQKQQQHKRSTLAENLYKESVKEYSQNLNAPEEHGNILVAEKLTSNHIKYDMKCDKLYRKNIVNNPSPRKLGQSQHQLNAEKKQIKYMHPVDIASRNRLQRNLSKSDTALNFLCSDTPETVGKYPSSYSRIKVEQHTDLVDKDKTKRFIQKTKELKLEPVKPYRNATNQKTVYHQPLTKTKSFDFTENEKKTEDSYRKNRQPVLPWSVSDMINKFAYSPNNETPHSNNSFK